MFRTLKTPELKTALKTPPRGFSESEFVSRTEKAQKLMREVEVDAMIYTTEESIRYFSGFHTQFFLSPTRPWYLIVPLEGKPIAVIPEIGRMGMEATWIDEIHSWYSPCPADDGISLLGHVIEGLERKFSRLGISLGTESYIRMPVADYLKLRDKVSGFEWIDITPITKRLHSIKSPAEIEKMRYIANITSLAFQEIAAQIELGMTEREIYRLFKMNLLAKGADQVPYLIISSGPNGYDNIIMGPTERVTKEGDILVMDTGAVFDGYYCDFDRNYSFGPPKKEVMQINEILFDAVESGLQACKPGALFSDLFFAMANSMHKEGCSENPIGRMGHSLGMLLTEWPSVAPDCDAPLEPGMVITLEPSMTYCEGRMLTHEEEILITEEGPEVLSIRAPKEIAIVGS